ncbi:MAG: efflux RND transporter periplasmic adaptor subunit [Gammaproteobacteria bacterium]|nr:efflux RND transporter periplasmic adaptor subunit [Gammaproteobacteria bacterium]
MTEQATNSIGRYAMTALLMLAAGIALGMFIARSPGHDPQAMPAPVAAPKPAERKVLYWYDPMKPEQHFDKPGRSPFMDMDLVPRYAEPAVASQAQGKQDDGIAMAQGMARTLGLRTVAARRGRLASSIDAIGEFQFNQRDVATLQSRADGFVERVYGRAPGDVVARGAPLVDLLLPSWGSAQQEFLAVLALGDTRLLEAARTRLHLLGMSDELIRRVERTRQTQALITLGSPIAGVIMNLEVRSGMRVAAGDTLAVINGSDPVWLEVAVPERGATGLALGAPVRAELAAYAGEVFEGKVASILPAADSATRSLRVRASFANADGRLHPGLSARVTIAAPANVETVLIPSAALIRGGQQDRVIMVAADGRYAPRVVQVGREAAGEVEILHGLDEGESIAASAQFLLDADASLKGLAPAAPATHTGHTEHSGHEQHAP